MYTNKRVIAALLSLSVLSLSAAPAFAETAPALQDEAAYSESGDDTDISAEDDESAEDSAAEYEDDLSVEAAGTTVSADETGDTDYGDIELVDDEAVYNSWFLNESRIEALVGLTYQLKCDQYNVKWTSSDPSIASVSPDEGHTTTITAKKPGMVTITAKRIDGYDAQTTAECIVSVTTGSVKLLNSKLYIKSGDVVKEDIQAYRSRKEVQRIECEEGAIFPADCSEMFRGYKNAYISLSGADLSNVKDMSYMFADCEDCDLYLPTKPDTSSVTDMRYMFYRFKKTDRYTLDLSALDTANVTDMQGMFRGLSFYGSVNLSSFDTSKVKDMAYMFRDAKIRTIEVSGKWDTSNVLFFSDMFLGCVNIEGGKGTTYRSNYVDKTYARIDNPPDERGYLTGDMVTVKYDSPTDTLTLRNGNVNFNEVRRYAGDSWNVQHIVAENGAVLPADCHNLFAGFAAKDIDLTGADTSAVTDMSGMFDGCWYLESLTLAGLDTSNVTNMGLMFRECQSLTELDLTGFDTSAVTDMSNMFAGCTGLKTIKVSELWTTDSVTKSDDMFTDCKAIKGARGTVYDSTKTDKTYARHDRSAAPGYLTGVNLPSTVEFNASASTLILKKGEVDKDDVQQYTGLLGDVRHIIAEKGAVLPADCSYMFNAFGKVTDIDLSKADSSKVTNTGYMFALCPELKILELKGFNTSGITDMSGMFAFCPKLESIDLSGFDTSNVTTMKEMFAVCGIRSIDLSGFNTANVKDMNTMFAGCANLTSLDLSSFDTSEVTDMSGMFGECAELTTITVSDKWSTAKVTESESMFEGSPRIKGSKGTVHDSSIIDKTYARIDGGTDAPGYLTQPATVKLDKASVFMLTNDTVTLTAIVDPESYTGPITWSSSNENIASVDNGVVTGIKNGEAVIKATLSNGQSASCRVVVKAPVDPTGITLDKESATVEPGGTLTLKASLKPLNAVSVITWTSDKPAVATVDENGTVTGIKTGTAVITAKTSNGKTATCTVTVPRTTVAPTGITLNKSSLNLIEGGSETITATVSPADATNKTVTWTSDKPAVATVANGKITAVAEGTAIITAKTSNGLTATCTITVTKAVVAPTGITLNKTALGLTEGGCETITATVSPADATDKTVTWTSDKPAVATVANGRITAVAEGTAVITAKTANGLTATCKITVTKAVVAPTGITLNKTSLSLIEGGSETITATVSPADATNKTVTWTSDKPAVATVANGKITAVAEGTAVITAKTSNGLTATCTVTVTKATIAPTGITLNKTSLSLIEGGSETITATVSPADATNKTVTWTSNKPAVATVANGKITAVAEGTAVITAKTSNGLTATCTVTVTKAEDPAPAKPTTVIKTAFGGRTVQLNCTDTDAEIYYQFGSSNITSACKHVKAGETIFLNEPMTGNKAAMYFKAYKNGKWSVLGKWGVLNVQIAKPLISQSGKASENKFKIYTQTKNSYIIYTLDGSKPAIEEGTQKLTVKNGKIVWGTTATITVPKGRTIKAIAVRCGLVTSDVMTYTNK